MQNLRGLVKSLRSVQSSAMRPYSAKTEDWSAAQYLKFEKERSRPARDLLAQVPLSNAHHVVDLGCGPGNSTAILRERYPSAKLEGMDSSPDMLKKARQTLPDVAFQQADLTTYVPPASTDLLFSNAVFQWLPSEQRLGTIQRLIEAQDSGSVFAFQVPDNFAEPSHAAMRDTASDGPWMETLRTARPVEQMQTPQEIYDALKPLCSRVDIWHTFYYHVLESHEAIVEWVKGTGLRPFLDPLPTQQKEEYLAQYLERIRKSYPSSVDGSVILRFPRLFTVAIRQ